MLPVVSGTGIGLDNTCKGVSSSQEFFGRSSNPNQITALNELIHYKNALEVDLSLLSGDSPLKQPKEERLQQINDYIVAIIAVQNKPELNSLNGEYPTYPASLTTVMQEEQSNLYSMHLRPTVQDVNLRSINPVFSLNRKNNNSGNPDSVFYTTLQNTYKTLSLAPQDARARLITAVLASTAAQDQDNDFEGMKQVLRQKTKEQLGVDVDFTQTNAGQPVTKEFINNDMGFDDTTTPREYIEALLGYCAPHVFDTVTQSHFYTAKTAEELSVVTQFFLGSTNIYCASRDFSTANFGRVLDESANLSQALVARVMSVQQDGLSIEDALLAFVNEHQAEFQLTKPLALDDMNTIKTTFTERYAEIKDSPHFDEFSVLETNKPGLFVTHQGSICTDFAELAKSPTLGIDSTFFQTIRAVPETKSNPPTDPNFFFAWLQSLLVTIIAFCTWALSSDKQAGVSPPPYEARDYHVINQTGTIPHKNAHIAASVEVNFEALNETQLDDLLKKLPIETQHQMLKTMPALQLRMQLRDVLNHVARGEQAEIELLLQSSPEAAPQLLLTAGAFTDYSGRTFNCTAYEYAYWAKDTHMCRMLEAHMDENTKATMLVKVTAIDTDGLTYEQHGHVVEHSTHFDMTPLKTALQNYVNGFDAWNAGKDYDAMKAAWMQVGLAQRDLPVHVVNEYCRPDRSFHPSPVFNEDKLPRVLTYYNYKSGLDVPLFPLVVSGSSGLGVDFALIRGAGQRRAGRRDSPAVVAFAAALDLAAVSYLDEVRSADLTLSRTNLGLIEPPCVSIVVASNY